MADDSINVSYNQNFGELEQLLSGVKQPGSFFTHGRLEIPMPTLKVDGVGVLSFPIPLFQIKALIQEAVRAPYGRGEDTILDESVRKVWQLPPEKVSLSGKSWGVNFSYVLQTVIHGLGCDGKFVTAELYKFLVYDTGGFFLAHRDTEKAGGMFATLVITLPSAHRGGELIIRHAGREAVVDHSQAGSSEVSYAAFYADCEHEVRPVTEGNRVCLIYNLIQQSSKTGNTPGKLVAPDYSSEIATAASLLVKHLTPLDAPAKIAWLLEHHYSPEGLSFADLKSADAARAAVLMEAADRADCAVHLGIIHIEEEGAAEDDYSNYSRYSRRRSYRDYEDDFEDDEEYSSDFEVIEVTEWRHFINQWRDKDGNQPPFGEIPLNPGELLPVGALKEEKPDKQKLMEASGNEGASFERSYHRAAVVIWLHEQHVTNLLGAGVPSLLPYFMERVHECTAPGAPASLRAETLNLAARLIAIWFGHSAMPVNGDSDSPERRKLMIKALTQLGDQSGLVKFIYDVIGDHYEPEDNEALASEAVLHLLGPEQAYLVFENLFTSNMQCWNKACVELLEMVYDRFADGKHKQWKTALHKLAVAAVKNVAGIFPSANEPIFQDYLMEVPDEREPVVDDTFVSHLLNLLDAMGEAELRISAVDKFIASQEVFVPDTILAPALKPIRNWDFPIHRLWEYCVEYLLERSGHSPNAPADWSQEVELDCECEDCIALQVFACDPVKQSYRFRIKESRRVHVLRQIRTHGLDMDAMVEARGSPKAMVCTKNHRSYESCCTQYLKDIQNLIMLKDLPPKAAILSTIMERIDSACALATAWKEV